MAYERELDRYTRVSAAQREHDEMANAPVELGEGHLKRRSLAILMFDGEARAGTAGDYLPAYRAQFTADARAEDHAMRRAGDAALEKLRDYISSTSGVHHASRCGNRRGAGTTVLHAIAISLNFAKAPRSAATVQRALNDVILAAAF